MSRRARRAARPRQSVRRLRAAVAAAVAIALVLPVGATAQGCPKTTLAAVEAEVMCPVCGTPLGLATEAPQANRERALIQRLVDRCYSKERIKDVLVAQYGPGVLALPEPEGFDLAAYVVPALAALAAALGLALAARRWRGAGAAHGPDAAAGASAAAGARPGGTVSGTATATEEDRAAAERLDADLERYEL